MNFEHVIRHLQETQLMAEIHLRQLDSQNVGAENLVYMQESMRLQKRMAHIDMRLASISYKLGLLGGHVNGPQ